MNYTDTVINDTSKFTITKFGEPYKAKYLPEDDSISHLSFLSSRSDVPKNSRNVTFTYLIPRRTDEFGWKGYSFTVRHITELKYLEKSKHKKVFKFEIAVHESGFLMPNPTDYEYFIEVENDSSDRKSGLNEFVKNAKVSFFKFLYRNFEI